MRPSSAKLLWDHQECVPLRRVLNDGDLVLLISPVVAPLYNGPNNTSDPFEPFGVALATRHPWIRHITYTKRAGITGTHVAFIKRARVIIFIISGAPGPDEPSQADLAEITRIVSETRPHIVLACCSIQTSDFQNTPFPTIVQIDTYLPHELIAAAALLFGDHNAVQPVQSTPVAAIEPPKEWAVDAWREHSDIPATYDLWCRCTPPKYHLSQTTMASLLYRDGYNMHYVVRNPSNQSEIWGFCATYITYADGGGDRLVGSLALLLVDELYRSRGIGRSLHGHALQQLKKIRGVGRLQLGSTFPRLFYGPPLDFGDVSWFERRGWETGIDLPGKGQEVSDWILRVEDMPQRNLSSAGLAFRCCEFAEFDAVLEIVERETARRDTLGWFDQYAKLANTMNVRDIIVGVEGRTLVAAALVYTPSSDLPVREDLPWAEKSGKDVGGITCICIADDNPDMVNSRDSVMVRLLDSCIRFLAEQGMRQVFIDGIRGGADGFYSLGFRKWASYRDVWQNV